MPPRSVCTNMTTTMTHRERVINSLNFKQTDRLPKDLGGMLSTCISAFAYPGLVDALGLPPRLPRLYDTGQMLAMPDRDVLDALGCDCAVVTYGATNAFDQDDTWYPYDFNGRLPALVRNPNAYQTQSDGSILQNGMSRMVSASYVFDEEHGGQPVDWTGELPMYDLREYKRKLADQVISDEKIEVLEALCKRARESTDRAIFLSEGALTPDISIHAHGGMAVFPILCLSEPEYVAELHEIATEHTLRNINLLLPVIKPYVDVIMAAADDWGTQNSTIASPKVFRDLFLPYRRRINAEFHSIAPDVKIFLHTCGAIYDIMDLIIECGFDVLNPVQWCAGKHTYREWKDKARGRIALWGGGVNTQVTLPLGTVDDVEREVREVASYLSSDSGYIFCNIHNILAEIEPQKVIRMYRTAGEI
jgi:uroporphyrinogen decarboxylase